jgi:hypothetical protein
MHFVFKIDHHVQWFVHPTLQQIGAIENSNKLAKLVLTHPKRLVELEIPTNQFLIYI